jgi:hypothetical protein
MRNRRLLYASLSFLCIILATQKARALLVFNDGKDQVFVTATYSFGYDTNVFSQRAGQAAVTQALTIGGTYSRKAGLISVNASFGMNFGQFFGIAGQDYADPNLTLTFSKGVGRTTGSLSFDVQKVNTPDPIANDRAIGWDYGTTLSLRYPVIERFYLTGTTGVAGTSYANEALFSAQQTYTEGINMNFIYDSKLDLFDGYNLAISHTKDTTAYDNAFNFGCNGNILAKLDGSLSVGYSLDDTTYTNQKPELFDGIDANVSLNWRITRALSLSGNVTKEFSISSTDITTDTTSYEVSAETVVAKRFRTEMAVTYEPTDFLGRNGGGRKDRLWEFQPNIGTAITTHFRCNLGYGYLINYSNIATAAFTSEVLSFSITASY